jgi:hypothetical protein
MAELNQYAVSKVLGSKMKPTKSARFGNFALLETTAEALKARALSSSTRKPLGFTYDQDRVVVAAFEDVRQGAPPDAILWDRGLLRRFIHRCRELGLDAPDPFLARRLINVRKNTTRYARHGITISQSAQKERKPSIVPKYAPIIEFALIKLRYRYGCSIDDVLLDPNLGDQFERNALDVAPELSPTDLRLGALYIRKSRFLAKKDRPLIAALDPKKIDRHASPPIPLPDVNPADIPTEAGLIEIREGNRFLYIARSEALRSVAEQFATGRAFEIVASTFWHPQLDQIAIQFIQGNDIEGASLQGWENRLIQDRQPVFNWPVLNLAA